MNEIFNEIFRALGYLLIAGIVSLAWAMARDAAKQSKITTVLIKGLFICAGIALFANSTLGTHSENCDDDPIYGKCENVQDFEPTTTDRVANFAYFMTLLYVPVMVGALDQKLRTQNVSIK